MSFYSSIVKAYDEIFPLNKAQANFIEELFPVFLGKKVLDSGCGTGSLAIELGRRSATVEAFDLDDTMILKAKAKCPQAIDVSFAQDDLLKFQNHYTPDSFNLIYCLGNTLAHLPSLNEVELYIHAAAEMLQDGGSILMQVVNYDRVIENKISQLPTIDSENYIFERNYIPEPHGIIQFSTILREKKTGETYTQSLPLIPILKDDLSKMLSKYFSDVKFFGSFKGDNWSPESFHTVVVAQKKH